MKINKKLSKYILEMVKIDQELRFKAKDSANDLINYFIYAVDAIHNYRIRRIIERYGYPTQKLIGKKAMRAFWLLAQHQDYDLELQENCLKWCDFEPKNIALLTDRVLVNKGEKQIYGTQFYRKNEELIPRPIKDKKNIEKIRKAIGLETFNKYLKRMKKLSEETKKTHAKK